MIAQIQSALYRARAGIANMDSVYAIDRVILLLIYFERTQDPAHVGRS